MDGASAQRVEKPLRDWQGTNSLATAVTWAWGERAVTRADRLLERARLLQTGKRDLVDAFIARHPSLSWVSPVSYTHLTLPTSDLV